MKEFKNEEEKRVYFLKLAMLRNATTPYSKRRREIDKEIDELDPDDRATFIKINNDFIDFMNDGRIWKCLKKHT